MVRVLSLGTLFTSSVSTIIGSSPSSKSSKGLKGMLTDGCNIPRTGLSIFVLLYPNGGLYTTTRIQCTYIARNRIN